MNVKYRALLIAAASTLALSSPAVAEPTAANVFPVFSSESVGDNFDKAKIAALEARMEKFVSDGDVKGIATLLVNDGKVISHMQAGIRREADKAPIDEDTIYRIYSMSKPITGVALMQLYEEGKFSLDDPVSKYVPEFENLQVVKSYEEGKVELEPLTEEPTMRQLMSHTAGFAYGSTGQDPSNKAFRDEEILASTDMKTFIDKVAKVPLMHQPGKSWFYSASVDVQGAIVERLSGKTFGDYLQARLFKPMGMVDTGFSVPAEKYDRFSDVFGYHPVTGEMGRVPFPAVAFKPETIGFESGGGGLVSTLADYARFSQMLANGGELDGKRILKSETIKLMRTDVLTEGQKVSMSDNLSSSLPGATLEMLGFGLDFGIIHNDGSGKAVYGDGTYFWGGAAGTWFWIDPVNNLYFIGMIQLFPKRGPDATDFRGVSRDFVYGALVGK